ncbi:MAG: IS701 family transposase, partial [Planctomycetes bacterium]|nr:IS701 family transposase [Planctomycetota bacterium]
MERRFKVRLKELLEDAEVNPTLLCGVLPRLEKFIESFVASLHGPDQTKHTHEYVAGLISNLKRKNAEAIAYLHDQERQALQKFIGQAPWDHRPLLGELTRQVGVELGEADAVLVFDPSGHPKKGTESVGVQRQWCGRLGKVDNCQVGVYMAYVSRQEHALVDLRLYLPQTWAKDKKRRKKCGVPKEIRFHTRHELSLEMLDKNGSLLPHGWVAGDDEMGRSTRFRGELQARHERYLLAVPSNTLVQDQEATPPLWSGHGRHPQVPFVRGDKWTAALPASHWTTVEVRAGEKGPLVVELVKVRVRAKTERRRTGPEETLVVMRERQPDGTTKHDYYLSNAACETPLVEFARVAKAEHRIEECLQRAKGEAGLSDYEVRTWEG